MFVVFFFGTNSPWRIIARFIDYRTIVYNKRVIFYYPVHLIISGNIKKLQVLPFFMCEYFSTLQLSRTKAKKVFQYILYTICNYTLFSHWTSLSFNRNIEKVIRIRIKLKPTIICFSTICKVFIKINYKISQLVRNMYKNWF